MFLRSQEIRENCGEASLPKHSVRTQVVADKISDFEFKVKFYRNVSCYFDENHLNKNVIHTHSCFK